MQLRQQLEMSRSDPEECVESGQQTSGQYPSTSKPDLTSCQAMQEHTALAQELFLKVYRSTDLFKILVVSCGWVGWGVTRDSTDLDQVQQSLGFGLRLSSFRVRHITPTVQQLCFCRASVHRRAMIDGSRFLKAQSCSRDHSE